MSPLTAAAPIEMAFPEQFVVLASILAAGGDPMVIVTDLVPFLQPYTESFKVYVVVVVGETVGFASVEVNPLGELVQE